jgi:hypothetical protein
MDISELSEVNSLIRLMYEGKRGSPSGTTYPNPSRRCSQIDTGKRSRMRSPTT